VLLLLCLMYMLFYVDSDLTGTWTLPFLGSIALLLIGAGLALR
jgi:hypothetical protein